MTVPDDATDARPVVLIAVDGLPTLEDLRGALHDDYRLIACAAAVAAVRQSELHADVVIVDANAAPRGIASTCRRIRAASSTLIVAIDSAAGEAGVERALNAGADDHVAPPFGTGELAARIRALLRRATPADEQGCIVAGPLSIDPLRHVAQLDGRELALTATEFALLALLARNLDRVVPRDDILVRLWGADHVATHQLLRVAISRLRTKLGARSRDDIAIDTVAGVGYLLVTPARS